jgi:glycosyltransferase involved in cell wall biosynthesis
VRVEWRGYVWLDTGYASELRSFVLGLDRLGHRIVPVAEELLYDVVGHKAFAQLPARVSTRLSELIALPRAPGEGALVVHHGNRAFVDISRGDLLDYHVFRGVWETSHQDFRDKQDSSWQADEVWVASWHTYQILLQGGMPPERIRHVPQGFNPDAFPVAAAPLTLPGRGRFNFLSVFAWSKRKGWDALIKAFVQEFPPGEKGAQSAVTLTLKVSGFRSNTLEVAAAQRDALLAELGVSQMPENILWVDSSLADSEMAGLYAAADAFVLPTRAEGWGRPFMEAMAMGIPVVGTGWGGHMDFMNASNAYLLPYRLVSAEQEFDAFSMGGHMWAEVDPESLQSTMRHVFENQAAARIRAENGQKIVRHSYSEAAVMAKASDALRKATQQMHCGCAFRGGADSKSGAIVCAKDALRDGRTAEALACFRTTLARLSQEPAEQGSDEMEALFGLGVTYFLRGGIVMASKAFQQCMDACPQMAVAQKTSPLNSELFRQALVLCPVVRLALLSKGFVFAEAWLHEGRGGEKVHEDFWSMALFSASVRDTAEVCGVAQMLSLSLSQPLLPAPCSA